MLTLTLWMLVPAVCSAEARNLQNTGSGSTQALVIERGRTVMLNFSGLRRVAVGNPSVADVSVLSADELMVMATAGPLKDQTETMLYIWDREGRHNFAVTVVGARMAESIARRLEESLSPNLSIEVVSDTLIVVEGTVPDSASRQNLLNLLDAASTDDVSVVGMIATVEDEPVSRAAQASTALGEILGPEVRVSAWGEDVIVVEGELEDQQELARARDVIATVGEGLRVVDMLTIEDDPMLVRPPVEQVQQLLGEEFAVTQLRGNLISVEGVVDTQQGLDRVSRVLEGYPEVEAINLVQLVPPKPDLETAERALRGALEDTEVVVSRVGEEALMLEGSVPDEEGLEHLGRVKALFEEKVPIINLVTVVEPDRRRVMVAVKVLEVTRGADSDLGVNWGQYSGSRFTDAEFRDQPFLFGHVPGVDGWPELYRFATQIRALIEDQKARVLSEPNLLVNEEEEAEILIGGEIPVPVAQPGPAGASITVEWREFGVTLKMRPTISPDNRLVKLEVSPEVSSLDFASGVTVAGLTIPALRTRRADTIVSVDDGGVLAIGGLIQTQESKSIRKIPVLGDLPIIGQFFRADTTREETSELIILVMPQILGEDGRPLHPMPIPEGIDPEELEIFGIPEHRGVDAEEE